MRSASATAFCKQRTCPASEKLWLFAETCLTQEDEVEIGEHLAACDFCGAEVQLLSRHPPVAAHYCSIPSAMPAHVRRLVEDLFAIKTTRMAERLVETIYEKEGLTLTDA